MKRILFAGIALAGLVGFGATTAQAQDYHRHGGHGWGTGRTHDYGWQGYGNRGFGYGGHFHGRQGGYYRPHYDYHDTSHFDYHPGTIRRHFNHYDYVPGHYHFHRQGHWDAH